MQEKTQAKKEQIVIGPASKKQEMFLNSDATITLAGGAAGSGKALKHGEKVLTPTGFRNIEDIKVGDLIVTPENRTEKVLGVYPQGEVDIYKVTFQDGNYIECCKDHLWQYHESRGRGTVKVSTTEEIQARMQLGFEPIVPLVQPLEFSNATTLPIKPYTLGVLLGDGSITTKSISFVSVDSEIVESVIKDGYTISEWNKNSNKTPQFGVLDIQQDMRDLGLLGKDSSTKFIPDCYKNASLEDRKNLIQGLMDTDGYVDTKGSLEYCTVSEQLAKDVKYVLNSLGCTVTITEKQPYFTYKGERKAGKKAYILYIRSNHKENLVRLSRKVNRLVKRKTIGNKIIKIEKTGVKYLATCIAVSGEEKLFVTSNFIVTHNTYTALLIALKFMQHPRATGVIFRRTSKMITSPGSIWHEAVNLYQTIYPKGLKIRNRECEIVFPNGALLKFSHMQHASNMYDHKGGQYSFVAFDEATDFEEEMIVYLLSRMRNAYVDYKPQMFLLTNPDYNSFLRLWIQDFYLDQRGIPIPELAGTKRYFVRQGNSMLWSNTREELEEIYGTGDESGISSFTFIGANCRDNPPLLKAQPDYISRLMSLPRVERERLLDGSWYARPEASGLFKREWTPLVQFPSATAKQRVRSWDMAFSKPSEQYPDPDWTRGTLMSKDLSNVYTIEDMVSLRDRVNEVEKLIFDTAKRDGHSTVITIPVDPNAQAAAYARDLQRRLSEAGYVVRLCKPVKSKIVRFAPFSSVAQAGFVQVVEADWNKEFFEELEIFAGDGKTKDDAVDTCSDAFMTLNREIVFPHMELTDYSSGPAFDFGSNMFTGNFQSTIEFPTFKI